MGANKTYTTPQDATAQRAATRLRINSLPGRRLVVSTFCRPAKSYFKRMDAIETDLSLKKLHVTNTLEAAIEATRERLDVENSVDKELLDSVIHEEVKHKT